MPLIQEGAKQYMDMTDVAKNSLKYTGTYMSVVTPIRPWSWNTLPEKFSS